MQDLKEYQLVRDHQKRQLRTVQDYRLAQVLDDENKLKFEWRILLKPFNRSNH